LKSLSQLQPTTRKGGPRNFKEFRGEFVDLEGVLVFFLIVAGFLAVIGLLLVGGIQLLLPDKSFHSYELLAAGFWPATVLLIVMPTWLLAEYTEECSRRSHLALVCLPWHQGWPWLFMLWTSIPWGPCWLASLVRYLLTRHRWQAWKEDKDVQAREAWERMTVVEQACSRRPQ